MHERSALGGELKSVHACMCRNTCVRSWKVLQREGVALVLEKIIGDWTPWMEFPSLESAGTSKTLLMGGHTTYGLGNLPAGWGGWVATSRRSQSDGYHGGLLYVLHLVYHVAFSSGLRPVCV